MKHLFGLTCLIVSFTTYAQNAAPCAGDVDTAGTGAAVSAADEPIIISAAAYKHPGRVAGVVNSIAADSPASSMRLAAMVMRLWPDTDDSATARWTYEQGITWKGLEGIWLNTGDARYFKYIQHQVDRLVDKEGNIRGYKPDEYDPGEVLCGRVLLMLYKVTGQEKYYKAAGRLRREGGAKGLYGGPGRHYLGLAFF